MTTEFYPHNKASKDGWDSMCKECWKLRSKERSKKIKIPVNKKSASVGIPTQASKNSNVQKAEPRVPKTKAIWISAKVKENIPDYVELVSLDRLFELPEYVEFLTSDGNVPALIEAYISIYERRPELLFVFPRVRFPDKYFLPITQDLIDYKENKMYAKDVKVGMKIVPVIKTIDGPLSKSKEWAAVLEDSRKKEKFLWVIKVNDKSGQKITFVCAATKEAKTGDTFNTIDLRAFPWLGWECRAPNAVAAKKTIKKIVAKAVAKPAKPAKPAKKSVAKAVAKPGKPKVKPGNPAKISKPQPTEIAMKSELDNDFDRAFNKDE